MEVQIKPFGGKQLFPVICCPSTPGAGKYNHLESFLLVTGGDARSGEWGRASESCLSIASFLFSLTLQFLCNHSCIRE